MGETVSKSQGKVYVGDVVDLEVSQNHWSVAEIIGVDETGLTVCGGGIVVHLDFRYNAQKKRVRPAGTHTGAAGLDAASSRATAVVAETPTTTMKQESENRVSKKNSTTVIETPLVTASQRRLIEKYKVGMLVDVLEVNASADETEIETKEMTAIYEKQRIRFKENWYCAKVIRNVAAIDDDSVTLTLHALGYSTYTNKSITINTINESRKLSKFATKSLL